MTVELVLFIFFAMVLGPVVITLVYCGVRGCNGAEIMPDNEEGSGRNKTVQVSKSVEMKGESGQSGTGGRL